MPQASRRLRLENVDGVTVVSFVDKDIVDEQVIKEIGGQLYSLVEVEGHKQLLINFGNVERYASIMLGKLANLQKKTDAAHGKLKICSLNADLAYIFRITQLDKVIEVHAEEQAAIDKF